MMDHAKTLKWYFVMLRIHVLAWLWQECITQCIMHVRLVMGRVYYSWLWKDMKALVINTHETDLKL